MGASGWQYFVPYDADPARALDRLRDEVFASGKYYSPRKKKPESIEQLIEWCAESGTHSILDVNRIVPGPLPPSLNELFRSLTANDAQPGPDAIARYMTQLGEALGGVAPAPAELILETCETATPDHETLERAAFHLMDRAPRGCAYFATAYSNGAPSELLFAGKSGD